MIPARRLERALCAIAHSDRLVHGARTQLLSPLDRAGGRVLFPRLRLVVVHGRGEMGMRPKAMPPPDGLLLALGSLGDVRPALPAAGNLGNGQGAGIECDGVAWVPCLGEGGAGRRWVPGAAWGGHHGGGGIMRWLTMRASHVQSPGAPVMPRVYVCGGDGAWCSRCPGGAMAKTTASAR